MAKDLLYAKTQRIVLLIDLDPVLHSPHPDPYLAVVFSAAEKLLSFPRLSYSLFSIKLFFSSLSPLLSSSKLSGFSLSSPSLSFDLPSDIIVSLSRAFDTLKRSDLRSSSSAASASFRGAHVAASMRQIVYDYNWELVVRDPVIGTVLGIADDEFDIVRSNLVVLFSPLSRDLKWASEFLGVRIKDECLSDLNMFKSKLGGVFDSVNDLFVGRGIHLSWVDVKCEIDSAERSDSGLELGFFESGIKELGWGFCSTASIILGSSVVPFGLIYPAIGISPKVFSFGEDCRKFRVPTSLEIVDVNGKPLECKCSELELVYLETSRGNRSEELISTPNRSKETVQHSLFEQFRDGITKMNVRAVRMSDDLMELEKYTRDTFVVHEVSGESDQDQGQESEFWADRVLQIIARETGGRVVRRSLPIWQLLLSFLYREGYSVLVSLSNKSGCSWIGILKPFTSSSAFISVLDNGVSPQTVEQANCTEKVYSSKHKRKLGKSFLSLQDITWAEFCRSVNNYANLELEDAYFSKFSDSKKLKFLKCWVKQIKKVSGCSLAVPSSCKAREDGEVDTNEKDNNLSEETEKSVPSSASEGDIASTGNCDSRRLVNDTSNFVSESSESFISSLPSKIKQGVESEEVDLAALAERLVNSCVFHFSQRCKKNDDCESGTPMLKSVESGYATMITEKLIKMLLKEPKDLVDKHKKKDSSSEAYETAPNNVVREYELQMLFRMEILRSEIGLGTEESMKQKFVKHVCLLLEAIQCQLDGGFFGDWNLDKYVDRTIKARYNHNLGEVVKRIYMKMDLMLFTDEEPPDSFLNSEESSQSGKENKHSSKMTLLGENTEECREARRRKEEARKLVDARERRERARRFASFTSWMPDLQRVWAPKQAKTSRAKADQQQRVPKRKNQERSMGYDRVCETPMTGNKRSYSRTDRDRYECGTVTCSSVSKALFQDEP